MRRVRSIAPALLALTALGALAAPAGARTYCVSDPACVSVGGVDRGSDLQAALTAATSSAGADTVKIGAGRFSAADGFAAGDSRDAITVIGAGRDLTTLTATSADRTVLEFGVGLGAGHDATVSDLMIAMPPSGGVGVSVPQQIARVTIAGGTGSAMGLRTQDTTIDDVMVVLPLDGSDNTGVYRPNGTVRADGLTVTAHKAIDGGGGTDAYRHVRVTSDGTGIALRSSLSNTMTIDDAQIRMSGAGAGLVFSAQSSSPAFLRARFLTVRGDGTANSVGVASQGGAAATTADVTLEDSVVSGFDHALRCSPGSGAARFTVRWSAFDPGDLLQGCASAIDTRTGNLAIQPTLLPAANGDLLLPEGSAAIDAGDPSLTAPSPATDLAGSARLFDGNGDGTARVDMGAFEWAPPPPPPVVVIGDPPAPPPIHRDVPPTVRTPRQPVVRSFTISPRRFAPLLDRPLARARARSRGPHRGATFTYVLSAPAAVVVAIEQAVPGHRSGRGGSCRAGRGRGRPCTRWVRRTRLRQIASDAVRRSIAFGGRVGGRALPGAGYRATIVAHVDGAADSLPRSVRFTIL